MTFRNPTSRCSDLSLHRRLACLADAGPQAIDERLVEIESEWSAGRLTKASIGVLLLTGIALAVFVSPVWMILPLLCGLFLLQYLFGRGSWLAAAFHGLGYRASSEIDQEKFALKALRGDFRDLPTVFDIENKDDISRLEGEGGIALDPDESKPDANEAVRDAILAAKI